MEVSTALIASIREFLSDLDLYEDYLTGPLRTLARNAKLAVRSFLGFQLLISIDGQPIRLSGFEAGLAHERIATSLRLPLSALGTADPNDAITFYAATPGAFVDLAADLSYALHLPDPLARHTPHQGTLHSKPRSPTRDGTKHGVDGRHTDRHPIDPTPLEIHHLDRGQPDHAEPDEVWDSTRRVDPSASDGVVRINLDADVVPESMESGVFGLSELSIINQAVGVLIDRGHHPDTAPAVLRRRAGAAGVSTHSFAVQLMQNLTGGQSGDGHPTD